jgi:hypothetical protein
LLAGQGVGLHIGSCHQAASAPHRSTVKLISSSTDETYLVVPAMNSRVRPGKLMKTTLL